MIYTLTLSPALDYIIEMDDFLVGKINRTKGEEVFAGGKGINVSVVLKNLGIESVAMGFVAGFTGSKIEQDLAEDGCLVDFVHLKEGMSRINIKIKGNSINQEVQETKINGQGPNIPDDKLKQLFVKLEQIQKNDILVLAGSAPNTLPKDIYVQVMEFLKDKDVEFVVDAERELLLDSLQFKPLLVKPNIRELGDTFGVEIKEKEEILKYAKELQGRGARNVLVSLAGEGGVLLSEDGNTYWKNAPDGTVVNTVGAGDSMVAGFLAGYLEDKNIEKAFNMAVVAGSACAYSDALAKKEDIDRLLEQV